MHTVLDDIYAVCNIHNSKNLYFVKKFKFKVLQKI